MIITKIPQSPYSDGKNEFIISAIQQGWERADSYIPSFFKPIIQTLIELYTQFPIEMNLQHQPNTFEFDPNAQYILPTNYALIAGNGLVVVGHPRYSSLTKWSVFSFSCRYASSFNLAY